MSASTHHRLYSNKIQLRRALWHLHRDLWGKTKPACVCDVGRITSEVISAPKMTLLCWARSSRLRQNGGGVSERRLRRLQWATAVRQIGLSLICLAFTFSLFSLSLGSLPYLMPFISSRWLTLDVFSCLQYRGAQCATLMWSFCCSEADFSFYGGRGGYSMTGSATTNGAKRKTPVDLFATSQRALTSHW